jgi:hypothetical protein
LLDGAVAVPGSWSPDSTYFVFATQGNGLSIHFLMNQTGEVCTSNQSFSPVDSLRGHHAWLPDGRLLYAGASGEVVALTPCKSGEVDLPRPFDEAVTQISAYSPERDHILLKSKSAYWILDTGTFSALRIPEVTPNSYDLHWDTYAWLPDGEHLAIARLNGRKGSDAGSTLFLINGDTGRIENHLDLAGEFNQSAPWIEGLTEQEVLVHDNGKLLIIDFRSNPPKITDVLKTIFGLDIQYPHEVSAAGSYVVNAVDGYYLAVRLNHPRNQATYLYHSQTKRVYVYDHEYHTLLLFPDGKLAEMAKWEDVPAYRDVYKVVLVNTPELEQPRLALTGHVPREYPHLSLVYLPRRSQLAVASALGVSLVSLPGGEMQKYWSLAGDGFSPWILAAPDGSGLVAVKDLGGLYFIPLLSRE